MLKDITIAIDGFSSCGKSTLAKALAAKIGYRYIDSGAMYRAVTLYFIDQNIGYQDTDSILKALDEIHITFEVNPETGLSETYLNGQNIEKEIRTMRVSSQVSPVSAIKEVRTSMVDLQRKAGVGNRIVMDGRDIGTNVFPDAALKIFMTADPQVRAQRRFKELCEKGTPTDIELVFENLQSRDFADSHRKENPLTQAKDAIVLDNSELTPDQQLELVLNWYNATVVI